MKILIVEDDEAGIGKLLRTRLNPLREKFPEAQFVLVGTFEAGIAAVTEIPHPDVVFLDLGLPDSTWMETLDRIDQFDDISPVIIITGHPEEKVRALLSRPEVEIIHKEPTMWGRVLGAIANAISRSRRGNFEQIAANIAAIRQIIHASPSQ